jgi:hypothetical protein
MPSMAMGPKHKTAMTDIKQVRKIFFRNYHLLSIRKETDGIQNDRHHG